MLNRKPRTQEWIPKRCYNYGNMGHTRRYCTQLVLSKVCRVRQPPTSSSHTYDQGNCVMSLGVVREQSISLVPFASSKGMWPNDVETNNWESLQQGKKFVVGHFEQGDSHLGNSTKKRSPGLPSTEFGI